jgi:phosphatidylglycerophosphatase A
MSFKLKNEKNPVNEDVKVPLWANITGSGLLTGYIPVAPGTAGSFLAFLLYLIPHVSEWLYLLPLTILLFFIGIKASERMRLRYGEDPPEVTIDEITGQLFTYLVGALVFVIFFKYKSFDPDLRFTTKIVFAFIGFLVFRFFDIFKIEPAKYFDTKNNGLGIMLDDIISGFYAGIMSSVVTHFLWYKFLIRFLG